MRDAAVIFPCARGLPERSRIDGVPDEASFGGGVGALALPWDDRFGAAHLNLPSFGHYPLRLTMPCIGSGEAVRRYHAEHPDVLDVLRYFDAATAATRIEIAGQQRFLADHLR